MSEPKETTDKTAEGASRKPLTLKRSVESGHIQQKFSHGRSKSVEVVKKRSRMVFSPEAEQKTKAAPEMEAPPADLETPEAKPTPTRQQRPTRPTAAGKQTRVSEPAAQTLSQSEIAARARALAVAQVAEQEQVLRDAEARRQAEQRAMELAALKEEEAEAEAQAIGQPEVPVEAEAGAAAEAAHTPETVSVDEPVAQAKPDTPDTRAETADKQAHPIEASKVQPAPEAPAASSAPVERGAVATSRSEVPLPATSKDGSKPGAAPQFGLIRPEIVTRDRPTRKAPDAPPPPKEPEKPAAAIARPPRPARPAAAVAEEEESDRKRGASKPARGARVGEDQRFRGRLTITNALDESQRQRSIASLKRKREREKMKAQGPQQREKIVREVIVPEVITIQDLANRMSERAVDVIRFMMQQGAMHKINDVIDADSAELIVAEFGHTAKRVSEADVEEGFIGSKDSEGDLEARAPVVTIMGHVDHGKTSLLDALRKTNVVSGEAGGITQHIGAYQVEVKEGTKVTFIDTPGHEAFTAMRARGAKVTDIVVLVVAADDGVMPQTVEAIHHAKAAEVPLIVAINKIDKPGVDPTRVRTELLHHEVVVESMSGETLEVEVSALKRLNLDKLLEAILLQSELLELRANPKRSAEGYVIEAKLERGRGPVGTLLVQRGTLGVGNIVVAGSSWGRVRAMIDDKGRPMISAGPSVPVEVLGFDSAPEAGDQFAVVENEQRAREITDYRMRKRRDALGAAGTARTLEQMMQQIKDADRKEVRLLIKGDVQGSVEAISSSLRKLGTEEVEARIIHEGVGGITESDVSLASASNAIIIGFNVRANQQARQAAEREGIEIRYYNIIYDLVDEVKAAMSGLLSPTIKENFIGYAEILEVFNITKVGKVAGCRVTEGRVERGAGVRLLRDNIVIHTGKLSTLKRFKDEVKEVQVGQECGMAFENYQDIRQGDQIECFNTESIARTL